MKEAQVEELSIAYEWSRYKDLSEEHLKTKRDVKPLIVMAEQLYLWVLQKFKNN